MTKEINVSKEDVKEAFEFNCKDEAYKNQRTAFIRAFPDESNTHVHYHQQGNYYPPGMKNKPIHISPELFFKTNEPWMVYGEFKSRMKDEGVSDKDTLEELWIENKSVFWDSVRWQNELVDLERVPPPKREKLENVKVNYNYKSPQ